MDPKRAHERAHRRRFLVILHRDIGLAHRAGTGRARRRQRRIIVFVDVRRGLAMRPAPNRPRRAFRPGRCGSGAGRFLENGAACRLPARRAASSSLRRRSLSLRRRSTSRRSRSFSRCRAACSARSRRASISSHHVDLFDVGSGTPPLCQIQDQSTSTESRSTIQRAEQGGQKPLNEDPFRSTNRGPVCVEFCERALSKFSAASTAEQPPRHLLYPIRNTASRAVLRTGPFVTF